MKCFIIAEVGVNHNGSEDDALQLCKMAANIGADAVKFQTFRANKIVSVNARSAKYQFRNTGISDQYTMLKKLELTEDTFIKLFSACNDFGVEFLSSPFDIESLNFLISIGMKKIKIPSGEITHKQLIQKSALANLPIIMSTGMSTLEEVEEAVGWIYEIRAENGILSTENNKITIMHCTSDYPTEPADTNLLSINSLKNSIKLDVGYSDHTLGIGTSIAAVALGATVIEKHITIDKNSRGPDHFASLEPNEFKKMIHEIRMLESSFGDGIKKPTNSELITRKLVRRSIVSTSKIRKGAVITPCNIDILRPGTGIQPKYLDMVIGRLANTNIEEGMPLKWEDIV